MRRCVWSRNLKNEEVMARVVPQRHRKKKFLNNLGTVGINVNSRLIRIIIFAVENQLSIKRYKHVFVYLS